jgi:hypothetical protein
MVVTRARADAARAEDAARTLLALAASAPRRPAK